MKSPALPNYPSTTIVIRSTGPSPENEKAVIQRVHSLAHAIYTVDDIPSKRIISVEERLVDVLKYHFLRSGHSLRGYQFKTCPDGLNLGEGQQWNEALIGDSDQVALIDADTGRWPIEPPRASYSLTPEQFGAEFVDASRLFMHHHKLHNTMMWGFEYRQTQGPWQGRQGMHSSVGTNQDGFVCSGVLQRRPYKGHFLRNFIVIHRDAQGNWGKAPLLEDLYRDISEITRSGPRALGRYHGTRVRFPDDRTNNKVSKKSKVPYREHPDWLEGKRLIVQDFGEQWLNEFPAVFAATRKQREQAEREW